MIRSVTNLNKHSTVMYTLVFENVGLDGTNREVKGNLRSVEIDKNRNNDKDQPKRVPQNSHRGRNVQGKKGSLHNI